MPLIKSTFQVIALSLAVAMAKATPVEPGYGVPAAVPIQQVTLPVAPPVVEPVPAARLIPLAPAPVRVLNQPLVAAAPVPLGPSPLRVAGGPIVPVAPRVAPLAPLPLVRSPVAALAPAPVAVAPAVAPVVPVSQFHAQDEFGGFNFGYQDGNSARQEIRTPDGVTRGAYSYVDANGVTQTVNYVADAVNGFRVAASNLPVAPVAPVAPAAVPLAAVEQAALPIGPAPVAETPEVLAARQEFQAAFDAAVARAEADQAGAIPARKKRAATEELSAGYGAPLAPVVPVPAPVVPVVPAPAPIPVAVPAPLPAGPALVSPVPPVAVVQPVPNRRAILPVAAPAPFIRPVIAPRTILPVAPAPVVPGPARVIPAAAAEVRTPLTAVVEPAPVAAPVLVRAAPSPAVIPTPVATQFRQEDELAGVSSFGYSTLNSARQESRAADGSTTGSYSYVDPNGVLQTVHYVADDLGFRVAASNLPVAPAAPVVPVAVA